ncbi:MAG: hypothetical protein EXS35_13930 [Pedosphaera sp.]|nr:hypothetical protein [Pedosphaera sp.]
MSLTAAQQKAVAARGNVLVMAGAGTGKTSTLVARCIDCLSGSEPASLDQLLVVTFTEAAAAEARERIRGALDAKFAETSDEHWAQQLALFDAAHIGTLHSFCFKLIRQHFYQLGLDPQVTVLDGGQAQMLAGETLGELLEEHYAGKLPDSAAVQELIEAYAGGRDEPIRALVLRLHKYSQTRADARDWLARQLAMFSATEPTQWREWLLAGIAGWRELWRRELALLAADNPKAAECEKILARLPDKFTREQAAVVIEEIRAVKLGEWPRGRTVELRKPLEDLFADAEFLHELAPAAPERGTPAPREPIPARDSRRAGSESGAPAADPLAEDWNWSREPMLALLRLTEQFAARFTERKRADGVMDFQDLEQLALELLWENRLPPGDSVNSAATIEPGPSLTLSPRGTSGERAGERGDKNKTASSPRPSPPLRGGEGEECRAFARRPSAIAQHWRGKLRFVFVDEYQDINAAQDRIIAALSGEGADANRFLVGDVKQSIYRFRLAEPGIFRGYARDWRGADGITIPLAENFRSRAAILEFANAVFAPLMREEIGGVVYDKDAELIPGRKENERSATKAEPEVEILFRLTERNPVTTEAGATVEDLKETEKEARHIAARLRELKASNHPVLDRETKEMRPVAWRDMAVLLRAPANKAEGYAKQFERAGVPLEVTRGGFYDTLEVADLLNLLRLLDNPLQDVPLLAVLHSPLVALSLDELATIRLAAKGHFWTALVRNQSNVQSLKSKVGQFLTRFARWRKLARQASLSKCLEAILAETHYAEWLRAQERGAQRHGNVQRLLGLAEQFDQFQRQGLFRFLRFVEAQREAEVEPEAASASAVDAVRLMSVHQSKGLEFPVVVVADLGKGFNFGDLRAEIILDEEFGLCPQVRPPRKNARYPSVAHWLARQRQQRELLGEELRLLYVAMTRARDKLILTGAMSRKKWDALPELWPQITPRALASARSVADWLRLWLAHHGAGAQEHFVFRELPDAVPAVELAAQTAVAAALPELDDRTFEQLRGALTWDYAFKPATERAAKTSVTALRRLAEESDEEAEQKFSVFSFQFSATRLPRTADPATTKVKNLSATDIGKAHHKFLQHVALEQTSGAVALKAEAERLKQQRVLSAEEGAALDFAALEGFWSSEIGKKIRSQAGCVQRELPFTARFAPAELDSIVQRAAPGRADDEFVIVQGVADLVVLLPEEIWLLDFKTDAMSRGEVEVKEKFYAPQLQLYALALERIYGRRVTSCWLHFLACGVTTAVPLCESSAKF